MSKPKTEITAEAVQRIISESKPTSLTQVAHALGLGKGSVSGSVAKRLRAAVPDLDAILAANKPAKDAKGDASGAKPKTGKKAARKSPEGKPAGTAAYPIPDCVPYRASSGYGQVFSILFAHREKGISKTDLVAKYKAWSRKPQKNCEFDVHVVTSPKEDGSSHRSAARAAQTYWVERENDFLRLRLVGEGR